MPGISGEIAAIDILFFDSRSPEFRAKFRYESMTVLQERAQRSGSAALRSAAEQRRLQSVVSRVQLWKRSPYSSSVEYWL